MGLCGPLPNAVRRVVIFKFVQKCHFLRVGDEEKNAVPMGETMERSEIDGGNFSL